MMYLAAFITFYLTFVWIALRLIVPHLGFTREPIPSSLPPTFLHVVTTLNEAASSDRDFLEAAYAWVTTNYTGSRIKTITHFWRAFGDVFTKSPGFLPCTGQNYLLRAFLIQSGRFNEKDIRIHTVPLNLFIHQYLEIHIENEWLSVDPWASFLGLPLGKRKAYWG